jgi:tryptophanyl-tRNA synthetase
MTDMTGLTPGVMDKSIQTAALFMDDAAEASANRVLKSLVANFQKATEQAARSRNDRNDASWILKFLVDALQSANDSHNKQVDKSNE